MTLGTFDEGASAEVVRGVRGVVSEVEPSEESSSGGMTTGAAAAAAAAAAVAAAAAAATLASHSADVLGAIVKPFAAAAASTSGVTMSSPSPSSMNTSPSSGNVATVADERLAELQTSV